MSFFSVQGGLIDTLFSVVLKVDKCVSPRSGRSEFAA